MPADESRDAAAEPRRRKPGAEVPPFSAPGILLVTASPRAVTGQLALRTGLLLFAVLLGLGGTWLTLADVSHSRRTGLPLDRPSASAASEARASALLAARIGIIRGDLWAEAAFADAGLLWQDRPAPPDPARAERLDRARTALDKALSLAPANAEGWLFLAELPSASGGADPRVARLLEMTYYTAPNAVELAPWRIERAASSTALSEPTIQDLVRSDIRRVVTRRPQLEPAIVAAYRNASPQNRGLLEALAADVDAGFAQRLRASAPK